MPRDHHAVRPKYDTLFADPRHYRGDCRLVRTAIRRGWLKDAPQADRNALSDRFHAAVSARWESDPDQCNARALFAEVAAMMEMDRDNTAPALRLLRYAWAGQVTDRITGRPRECWHVSDFPNRLDAAAIQRDATRAGHNPLEVRSVLVRQGEGEAERRTAIDVIAMPDRFRRMRLLLVCPRCGKRRGHLYPTVNGPVCRTCGQVRYGSARLTAPATPQYPLDDE